jgi:hypothetical protein
VLLMAESHRRSTPMKKTIEWLQWIGNEHSQVIFI